MAVTAIGATSSTPTINTEDFIDVNSAGTFTFHIDMNALQTNDFLEVRVYQMVLTGGTPRPVYVATFQGGDVAAREDKIFVSVPISNELTDSQSLRFSIKQTLGTARSLPRKVLKHA